MGNAPMRHRLARDSAVVKQVLARLAFVWIIPLGVIAPGVIRAQSQTKPKTESAPSYRVVELPLRSLALSSSGWVAGITPDQKAARWSAQTGLERVPLPAEFVLSEATGINSKGDTVGTAFTADSSRCVAFVFRQGKVFLLPGEQSHAEGINEAGEIVGQARLPEQKAVGPVLWRKGSVIDLKICCAGTARRINTSGLIVGDTYNQQGHYHAFLWDTARGARPVALPGEEYSSALALNDRGQVVVRAVPSGLLLYSDGRFDAIGVREATPHALNKSGIVVGSYGVKPEGQRAFSWDKVQGLRDLNGLIDPQAGWQLEVATSINDRGEIVGWGDHEGTENAGFLLLPRSPWNAPPGKVSKRGH
jgi:uncharacterized membrane protein